MNRLLMWLLAIVPVCAAAQETVIFSGAGVAPYELFLGDKKGWGIPVAAPQVSSNAGYLTVSAGAESGTRLATWSGKGEAQLYLGASEPQNINALVQQDGALVALVQVQTPPKRKVTLRMGCGEGCSANADIGPLLRALPTDQWLRVSFDLKCFTDGGLDASSVYSPFLLLTKSRMSLALSDVRLVPGAGPDATIKCR